MNFKTFKRIAVIATRFGGLGLVAFSISAAMSVGALAADPPAAAPSGSPPPWPEAVKAPAGSPNIVLIMLDDVGFAASSSFGGPAETPFLDRLAAGGLRYNRFHNTALCSPTRAALLSGRNHHKVGFGTVTEINNPYPGYNAFWPKSVVSLPEMLRRDGYSTAAFGKWHNTPFQEITPVGPFDRWPTGLGFEYFYGFMAGATTQWEPPLYRNTTPVEPGATPRDGYYLTTDLVNDAEGWVATHDALAPQKPYFLYFATGATHSPHQVPAEWIAKYKGKFDGGWDKLSEDIFARQKKLGVIPANAEKTPRSPMLPAWDSLSTDQKKLYARQMEVYAAFLAATDYEVGRLVDSIRKGPNADNTLIFYIVGDNGASTEGGPDGTDEEGGHLMGLKATLSEQLARSDKLGGPDLTNAMAAGWAYALDTPFQGAKADAAHFGGSRDPLIVSWPARIKDAGAIRPQFTHVNDIAPTIYDLLHISVPAAVDGIKQEPIDGVSFASSFTDGKAAEQHHVQYFDIMGNRGIYKDGWIAGATHSPSWSDGHRLMSRDFDGDQWELYNVDQDFSEAHNLAEQNPGKLSEMRTLFDSEAKKNNVYPLQVPDVAALNAGGSRISLFGGRTELVFPGSLPRLQTFTAPRPMGSHRLTAKLEIPAGGASGVIVSDGGRQGGFVLYVKDRHLVYEENFFGHERSIITSTALMPTGSVDVAYEFQRIGDEKFAGGTGRLFINGKPAGEGKISHVSPPSQVDSFNIGANRGGPVSQNYVTPAKFTGKVDELRILLQ